MSYLGNGPGVASQRIADTFTVTTTTSVFSPSAGYTLGYLDVYHNGVKLVNGDDFTASNGTSFTLTTAANNGDVVECVAYLPRGLSDGYTKAEADAKYPTKANNLSDLASASTARTNLGVTATGSDTTYAYRANNLSDLASASTARTNLGLGTLATVSPTGTPTGSKFLRDDNTWQTVSVTPTAVSSQANTATDFFALPAGTTAQRPASPANGYTRFNTTLGYPEWYNAANSSWTPFSSTGPYTVDFLVVAGGGGGGGVGPSQGGGAGGGGAGGYQASTLSVSPSTSYTVIVGGGGSGGSSGGSDGRGGSGSNSTFNTTTSIGGGGGGDADRGHAGVSGGSGGGGGGGGAAGYQAAGSGTSGQGNAGGAGYGGGQNYSGGGGGGASATGTAGASLKGGNGGAGTTWSNSTTYAGGGGGGTNTVLGGASIGTGGAGGGGNGGQNADGTAGTANTGGGGGSAGGDGAHNGGAGGSGIVIIRYVGSQRGTGGTVTSSGGYTYHTYTTSGTFTFTA